MTARFNVYDTALYGLKRIERQPICDARGTFERIFCADEMKLFFTGGVVQANRSITNSSGTVRGLHYQSPPYAEKKYVSCLRGEVFDVAVDIRSGSPTFLQWHAEILSEKNNMSLLIPEGFAHGFQAVSDDCELLYFTTAPYHAEAEGGINVQDPVIAIEWPETITVLSQKDRFFPLVGDNFSGLQIV